ncbi:MAG TPA: hypothetical protein VH062_22305 [Polyangiaceae bacterium]|nr:hypothetical protein [Polyangiaceae bacterium]
MATLLAGTEAYANPAFPALLEELAHMPCKPQCTVCHGSDAGGYGNFKHPSLVDNWIMYGLSGDEHSLTATVLEDAVSDSSDVDHDGILDVTELAAGEDPTDPTPGKMLVCAPETIEYGCVRVAKQGPVDNVATASTAVVSVLALMSLRRRRRYSSRR